MIFHACYNCEQTFDPVKHGHCPKCRKPVPSYLDVSTVDQESLSKTERNQLIKSRLKNYAAEQAVLNCSAYHLGTGLLWLIGPIVFISTQPAGEDWEDPILAIVCIGLLIGVPKLWVAFGLFKRQVWSKEPAKSLGWLGLFSFPVGTICNYYFLKVAFSEEASDVFSPEYSEVVRKTKVEEVAVHPVKQHEKKIWGVFLFLLVGALTLIILAQIFGWIPEPRY